MAGNPSGDNRPRDPWNKGNGGKQPPDLVRLLKESLQRLLQLLAGKPPAGQPGRRLAALVALFVTGLLAVFAVGGTFQISAEQRGVILSNGQVVRVVDPGTHWYNPLLETLERITLAGSHHYRLNGELATRDGQLVNAGVDVEYRLADPAAYVMSVSDPVTLLQTLTLSALRQAVGRANLSDLLSGKTEKLAGGLQDQLSQALSTWQTGLDVATVTLTGMELPETVAAKTAAGDKAQETAAAGLAAAKAYRDARREAAQTGITRLRADAEAYRQQVVAKAESETARFAAQLVAYEKAPQVTRDRLYFETMESLLARNGKVLIMDAKAGRQLVLPLAELTRQLAAKPTAMPPDGSAAAASAPTGKAASPEAEAPPAPSLYGPVLGSPPQDATGGAKP